MAAVKQYRRMSELLDVTGSSDSGSSPVSDGGATFPLTKIVTSDDLDAVLASVAFVDWRPIVLADPRFTPYGDGFTGPRYRVTLNNVVHVEGMVGCSPPLSEDDVGTIVTQFAADALPGGRLLFGCSAYGNNARFDVEPDGKLTFQGMLIGGGMIDWFTLTSVTYSVGADS